MAGICDKCKRDVAKITKDLGRSSWLCEDCLKEARKRKVTY